MRSWSTQDAEHSRALAYWVDTVGQALLELDIEVSAPEQFAARLQQGSMGPVKINLIEAAPQWMQRTSAAIARSRASYVFLLHLRAGHFSLQQFGRECTVRAGECVLVDSQEPYKLTCPVPTQCLSLDFPREWLKNWLPAPELLAARRLTRKGWGAALNRAVQCLDPAEVDQLALPASVVAEQIAALLALTTGPMGVSAPQEQSMLERLRATLRDRYYQADLSPSAVASQNGIGKRHLHFVFARAGTTFGSELIAVRLERARQMLEDRRFSRMPVGELSARCGFADPSHFARRFRRQYQLAPAQYKRQHGPESTST